MPERKLGLRRLVTMGLIIGGEAWGSQGGVENPLRGKTLFVDPNSAASQAVSRLSLTDPDKARLLEQISSQPAGIWLGDWNQNVESDVDGIMVKAAVKGALPVLVIYNIPHRDCGGLSAGKGGAPTVEAYREWVDHVAAGLKNRQAVVIVEPDTLGQTLAPDCPLTDQQRNERTALVQYAIDKLSSNGAQVYLEVSMWPGASRMAEKLKEVDRFDKLAGVSIGASGYISNDVEVRFLAELNRFLDGKLRGVIEGSREGENIPAGAWCNPPGARLGVNPTTDPGLPSVDAILWIKPPGESDGTCNGGPQSGEFWLPRAEELIHNR